jgi:hypothetical protein
MGRVLHPFVSFTRSFQEEYSHKYLEWRDDRNAPIESVILKRYSRRETE